ncbi:MAG TPA: MarR family winged helix-turn-helix transcriptional regulator [Syntrophobacter fumaroxidans]|nr:MarR family winged helix-turn-helix transcriptional regulator [Syntrophobacter fumaroxidans]
MKPSATDTPDHARCLEIGRTCACYSLRKAARAVTRLYDDFLRPSGLRVTQFSVLMTAKIRDPVTLTRLAHLTVMDRTTLTRNLKVLEKKKLIKTEPGEDRRERRVHLTDLGEEKLVEAIPLWEKAQSRITSGLGEERMDGFQRDLLRVVSLAR